MKILAVDIGTGTQDILLFDSSGPVENSLKMVMPSATQIAAARVRRASIDRRAVLLTGVIQGGGPCAWAVEDHIRSGGAAFATADAARTFDDDLERVSAMGIGVIGEDEAKSVSAERIELRDLDLGAIRAAFASFGVDLSVDGLALGCLDHGAAPPGYSDRLFRFDHLRRVVSRRNDLTAFAFAPEELPDYLTRARAVVETARGNSDAPIVFLDTGPAAALGALQDPHVHDAEPRVVLNLGNMHALAFHLDGTRIIGLYEHHTGEMTREQVDDFTARLVRGTLRHEEVFETKGHGVFYAPSPADDRSDDVLVAVTGPQRAKLRGSALRPYFPAPHGDMMISGCFGLVRAFAEKHPGYRVEIERALTA